MATPIKSSKNWTYKFEKIWQAVPGAGQWQGFQNAVKDAVTAGATIAELEPQFLIAGERIITQIGEWQAASTSLCANMPYHAIVREAMTGLRTVVPAVQLETAVRQQFSRIMTNSVLGPLAKASSYIAIQVTLGLCATCKHALFFSPGTPLTPGGQSFWKGMWFSTQHPDVLERASLYAAYINSTPLFGAVLGICGIHKPGCFLRCQSCAGVVDPGVNEAELSGWKTTGLCLKCGLTGLLSVSPPKILTGRLSDDKATTRRYHEKFKRLRK